MGIFFCLWFINRILYEIGFIRHMEWRFCPFRAHWPLQPTQGVALGCALLPLQGVKQSVNMAALHRQRSRHTFIMQQYNNNLWIWLHYSKQPISHKVGWNGNITFASKFNRVDAILVVYEKMSNLLDAYYSKVYFVELTLHYTDIEYIIVDSISCTSVWCRFFLS